MWTVAQYIPVALFSLKPATATSSGGKTLICPTPFAIKMALLDAALRTLGQNEGKRLWPTIRDLRLMVNLPERVSVINTFTKIVRPKKHGPSDDSGTGLMTPLGSTIAYREYVSFGGAIQLAAQLATEDTIPVMLTDLFPQINYLGKRGGFVQLLKMPDQVGQSNLSTDQGWITLTEDQAQFSFGGTLQILDDCGSKMTFDHADIYSSKRITLGKERILRHIVLPYQVARSSRGFTLYERIP
ncbi:MAG: hypothetical protein SH847_13195 [Roseiflexaceae bacterium]|nr:hypothetical protein [Roseiflexaceae bacterium]